MLAEKSVNIPVPVDYVHDLEAVTGIAEKKSRSF